MNPTSPEWAQALYDVSFLQAQVNSLYDYGRNKTESGPDGELTIDEVKTGMTNAIGMVAYLNDEERYQPTVDLITRFHAEAAN